MNVAASFDATLGCPVCGKPTRTSLRDLYDDRYGYPGLFVLQECPACGHRHIPARFQPEELTRLYTDYYPRGAFEMESFAPDVERRGFMAWLDGELGSAFRWVPRDVRVLDIGCGVGRTLAYHRNRGCTAVGIEADGNVQPIAERYGLDIRQGVFDGTQFQSESFDYVTLDQVAEHALDPHALMQGVARVLKPGGTAIVTTPNSQSLGARLYGRGWLNWHVPYHLQFYTSRSFSMVAQQAGLAVVKSRTVTPSVWQFYQWRHLATFPARGEKSRFWFDGQRRTARRSVADYLIAMARLLRLYRWLSRIPDMAGLGDNFVFVLQKP